MDELNTASSSCSVRFQCGRVANSVAGFMNTLWSAGKIASLVVVMPLNVYAAAERFPGVQVQLDELTDAAGLTESPTAVTSAPALKAAVSFESPVPGPIEIATSAEGNNTAPEATFESPGDKVVNQELASLDVADTGVLKPIQNAQPTPVVSRQTVSLEVVDTGTARQVQRPKHVEAVTPETQSPVLPESAAITAAPGSVDDEVARNYEVMAPATGVAESSEPVDAAVATTGNADGQAELISDSVASEDVVRLPYAVLLAILALMSMIPVARHNG